MRDRLRGLLLAAGLILQIGAAATFLLRYRVYQVPTTSMSPAIESGDRIVVDTWSRTARRGDIVLVTGTGPSLVKRVAAVAGDTVTCCDATGRPQVNGSAEVIPPSALSLRVPAGALFLLGDNLPTSVDSRATGPAAASSVQGRVVALAYPAHLFPDRAAATLCLVFLVGLLGLAFVLLAGLLSVTVRHDRDA
ncbi:signal peptidase I [Actinoplanes sp. NPDC026619]|uniref:signal peptidase I n=1 Tax=Actinoplanes sp. NPDC026619 TaxID=3155798 RepID=UPI0033EF6A0C